MQAIFKSEFIDYERANYSDYIEFEFGKYPATWNLVDLDTAVDVRDAHTPRQAQLNLVNILSLLVICSHTLLTVVMRILLVKPISRKPMREAKSNMGIFFLV